LKNPKNKILVIIVMSVLLASSLLVAANVTAQQPPEGYISISMMYKDTQTGGENLLSNVVVNLLDYNGNVVASEVSNPTVIFHVPLGNYIIDAPSISLGSYVYEETKEQIVLSSSSVNTNLTMFRTALNNTLSLNIYSNNAPLKGATVNYYTTYGLEFYSGLTNVSTGKIETNVTFGTVNLEISYVEGGSNNYYYTSVAVNSTSESQIINVGNYNHIFGTVYDSSTGLPVSSTIRATLINQSNGQLWQTLIFNQYDSTGGSFNFYLPSSATYTVVLTADGYNINTFTSQSGYHSITLNKVTNNILESYTLSSNFNNLTYKYSIQLNNESIISGFNYNNIGVLYYQLKFGDYNSQAISQYFYNSIEKYTNKMILVDNNFYQLQGVSVSPFTINYAGFTVSVSATYTQPAINVSSALSQYGYIPLNLNITNSNNAGARLNYSYSINISSQYERVNTISGANISGYINNINIYNVSTTSNILLKLEKRQAPTIVLNSYAFALYWKGIQSNNYILNQSSSNYTIIVPANKPVSYNASNVISDIISGANWKNTIYYWQFDNGTIASGTGLRNVTTSLTPGIHTLKLSITDVASNTNTTTITIYSDGAYPNTFSNIKINNKVIISWTVSNATNKVTYLLNGQPETATVSEQNGVNQAILQQIKINETQLFEVSALYTNDTINGQILSHKPVTVVWDINNTKMSGNFNNASINYPTRNKTDWINVTYTDIVNNSITISIPVKVMDIMKPHPVILIYNQTGVEVSSIPQHSTVKLDGLNSTDPQNGVIASYLWTIHSSNGTALASGTAYNITNGTMTSPVLYLNFSKYGLYYILLNVSDRSGNYNVYNASLQVTPIGPDLVLNDFNWTGTFTEGTQSYIYVNVSNTGNAPASQYNIILYVNGKVYSNTSYADLVNGKSVLLKISWTPSSPGNFTLKVRAYTPTEPVIYLGDNVMSKTVSVNQAAWILPAIIIGIIVIIVVVAFVAFRLNKSRSEQTKFKKKGAVEKAKPKEEKKTGSFLKKKD